MFNFSYIIYFQVLMFAILLAVTLPFVLGDIYEKRKSKQLVKIIMANDNYKIYDISLIETLARGKSIPLEYMKYILHRLVSVSHDGYQDEKLKYFMDIHQRYLSDEIYNNLPSQISTLIKSIRIKLESPDEPLISNLVYNIQELVDKSNFRRKLNQSLTMVSIVVGIVSIASPFLGFLYK